MSYFIISASVTAYLIWLFEIRNCFCILFIAYNYPVSRFLTLKTLPNDPDPNYDKTSKSLNFTFYWGKFSLIFTADKVAAVDVTELFTVSSCGLLRNELVNHFIALF